ncbi:hypothetical protein SUGI_0491140 [Cryptomeria japonica]|uniref:uncharacterized protein LOC131039653 isoform X2 n=1 Tax=Cryptomeria japonica TaxID=3369 RepID=UPI002408DCFB|nr:uncharacterized protein LOC131039653 isoform X2 [Cryptomeria japonica]GLJ25637.1 hypothetical protein SUGI_0491140 [Cryptomeria japonica]
MKQRVCKDGGLPASSSSDELWKVRPPKFYPKGMADSALFHGRHETKEMLNCSSKAVCTSSSFSSKSLFSKVMNKNFDDDRAESCPFYFKWIVADLWPWKESGITLQLVEEAKEVASFRLMIVKGRLFTEIYHKCFQTRDLFTIWAFSQLLKKYPGMVPDLDLMFNCEDKPLISRFDDKNNQTRKNPTPLFHYCGHRDFYDILFPDWSYWGWPEIRIPPWEVLINEIQNGNQQVKWADRDPTAYWKGNPKVADVRMELLKCNKISNWNGHLVVQDWKKESEKGFENSKLSDQCKNRYKIYVEGNAWSVSLKNIMACDSPTLLITPEYYEFFQRGLVPYKHYWPVRSDTMCDSIKFAVNWGNNHIKEAIEIGRAGSDFMLNELKMNYVYDYMFHVLREYAKLLKYKPFVTQNAVEYCSEAMICFANEVEKQYMEATMVTDPSPSPPCQLREAHTNDQAIYEYIKQYKERILNVERMEEKE